MVLWLWVQDQSVFLSLVSKNDLALVSGPGHVSVRALISRSKCVSLAVVSGPKCVSFTGSGFEVRVYYLAGPFTL